MEDRVRRCKVLAVIGLVATAGLISGCAGSMNQDLTITGSAEGIRAFNDGLAGIIKTGKEKPEANSEYFQHRKNEEQALTQRANITSFWGKLTGGSK